MKIYCLNCGKELKKYKILSKEMNIEMKGNIYNYIGHEAVCPDCGEPLFVEDVLKYNKEKAYQAYRETNGIISQEEILSIPEKYHISKRNISKYLGWGEVTFSRYCSGYIPTKQNSAVLRDILANPEILMDRIVKYIQENPECTFAKRDLQKMIGCESVVEQNKIYRVSEYIVKKLNKPVFSRLRLMKLLYYVQGFCKAINGVYMFNNDCQAWQFGPVYPEIRDYFKDLDIDGSIYLDEIDLDKLDLDEDEKAVIDGVLAAFDKIGKDDLIKMTHKETPWINARHGIPDNVRSNNVIDKNDIAAYFGKVVKDCNIRDAGEIMKYTKDILVKK